MAMSSRELRIWTLWHLEVRDSLAVIAKRLFACRRAGAWQRDDMLIK